MACLHFIGGNKGGVGKSQVSRTLVEFCIAWQLVFTLAECDRVTPDVARIYRLQVETILAYFSEDPNKRTKADALFSKAIENLVIANLPANAHEAMRQWFVDDKLHEAGHQFGVSFCHWYVSNGGYDSVNFFIKTLETFGKWMPHIFVQNYGLCDNWSHVEQDEEFQNVIEQYQVQVVKFPKFPYEERNFIEAHQITLTEAINHPELPVLSRHRVKKFMESFFEEIEQTGAFTHAEEQRT